MRVLVTGAGGFLGRAVVRRLNEAGHALVALVHDSAANVGADIETRTGDIVNLDAMAQAVAGCDAVVHCAAHVTPFGRIDDYYDVNVRGTDNLLAACEIAGVRRFVFTSCAGVVLDRGDLNGVNETQRMPARAPTPYLSTKATAERHVLAANAADFATVALRPHLLWGPGESTLLPRLAALAKAGKLRLFGEAGKKIDSCYVDNAADAHLAALERLEPGARDRRQGVLHHAGRAGLDRRLRQRAAARGGLPGRDAPPFDAGRAHARIDRAAAPRGRRRSARDGRPPRAVRPGDVVQHRRGAARPRLPAARRDGRRLRARFLVPRA